MNLVKSFVIAGILFSGMQAFAHGDKACKQYWESCKSTKGKKEKMECVKAAAAADPTNGPACTAEMEAHKDHKKMQKAAGSTPGTSN